VAGGVYDFQNFEEVYLCNGLSSNLQNLCVPQKTSREYILLNALEQKTAFFASYRPKRAWNCPFFRRFWRFRTAVKVYMTSMKLSTTTPGPGTPPANSRRTKQFWSRPHGLKLFLSEGPELTAAAWRIASLSPIGRLEVIYDFKPYDNGNLYSCTV
jgi:hypothetical protein